MVLVSFGQPLCFVYMVVVHFTCLFQYKFTSFFFFFFLFAININGKQSKSAKIALWLVGLLVGKIASLSERA